MKNLTVNLFQFLIIILIVGVAACDDDDGGDELSTAELLIGTWTTSEIDIDAKVGAQSLTDYLINEVGLSPTEAAIKNGLFEAALASEVVGSLTLNSDNTYESSFGGGGGSGTWSLSVDEKTLTLNEGSDIIVITINSISGSIFNAVLGDDIPFDIDDDSGTPDVDITAVANLTLTK